jgi:hypothetical protein
MGLCGSGEASGRRGRQGGVKDKGRAVLEPKRAFHAKYICVLDFNSSQLFKPNWKVSGTLFGPELSSIKGDCVIS